MDAAAREFVRQRAGNRCEYCLLPEEADEWPFHVEHIIARQHGGGDESTNLCWACSRCNLYKGPNLVSLDPETWQVAKLFDPRSQQWKDHFALRTARIVGLTPTGRATARLLHVNDRRRVELRGELIERGVFVV
jgi:hypothetical protein